VGIGLCATIALLQQLPSWLHHEPGTEENAARQNVARAVSASADVTQTVRAGATEIGEAKPEPKPMAQAPIRAAVAAPAIDDAPAETPAPAKKPSPDLPVATVAPYRDVAPAGDPFKLAPPLSTAAPYVLPQQPWFALADFATPEPESCQGTEAVCAANRSLGTAITWAKSPRAAAEQASREGKLVFLIHVSGNFEDPGFT
jgi:hypothetical protein